MAIIRTRIPTIYRRTLYTVFLTSWCSGIAFFILSRFVLVEGEFGPEKHPLQFPVLKIHGAAAFLMMVSFGAMLISHVPSSWKTGLHRGLGLTVVTMVSSLIITAWLLYYLSSDSAHEITSNLHAAVGFSLPFVLLGHVVSGVKDRQRRNQGGRR